MCRDVIASVGPLVGIVGHFNQLVAIFARLFAIAGMLGWLRRSPRIRGILVGRESVRPGIRAARDERLRRLFRELKCMIMS